MFARVVRARAPARTRGEEIGKQSNKNNKPMTAAEWAVNIAKLPDCCAGLEVA
jgi:hypothetical protein